MYDEKEIEELYDQFLGLDGDMFLESDVDMKKLDNDMMRADIDISGSKIPSNYKNNNFLSDTGGFRLDKPDVSIQLDLLNQNFISSNTCDFERNTKSPTGVADLRTVGRTPVRPTTLLDRKVDEVDNELKEIDEKLSSPVTPLEKYSFHRAGWSSDALGLWHSGPSSLNLNQTSHNNVPQQDLSTSVTYITQGPQSLSSFSSSAKRTYSHQQLGAKVEMVYSLLSMLDTDNREDMSKTFLAMSSSPESCHAMRQSGCLPLLIQLIYSSELDKEVRNRAAEALHNVVHAQTDEKRRKREVRVLKLLQQVREYCDELKNHSVQTQTQESEKHPINATGTLMKLSFDAEHRQAICILGGLHAITDLIQVDHKVHGSTNEDTLCITMRRYAGMSLTNLTFGDGKNKALLCSFSKFLLALVDQLKSPSEDLRQVTASVLRNLSWRADSDSKQALRQVGTVPALTVSAMEAKKESTLKSILSALWNLSAHCSLNKIDICSVPGALAFLVKMLKYKSASNTLSIIENAGGILRNISSHIAVREDYRQILRDNCCFEVLLEQLKSPSLTIVSNACGTLWNLSARCPEDQRRLWEMGATTMLRSLVQSKHKMISMGSSAALKNLLAANPNENLLTHLDSTAKSLGLQNLPTLFVRKKRALEQELNITLAETCENIEPVGSSPSHVTKPECTKDSEKLTEGPKRSDSHESVRSSKSDTVYELLNQMSHVKEEKILDNTHVTLHTSLDEKIMGRKIDDQKLAKRYAVSMIPTPTSKKMNHDRINEKTKEEKLVCDDANGTLTETENKDHAKAESKQRNRKGIPVLKNKPRRTVPQDDASRERCSSTKSHEESSLPNEETESFEGEDVTHKRENHHDSVINSLKKPQGYNTYSRKIRGVESNSVEELNGIPNIHEKYRKDKGTEEEQENAIYTEETEIPDGNTITRNETALENKNTSVKMGAMRGKIDFVQFDNNCNVSPNKIEGCSHENRLLSQDFVENTHGSSNSAADESVLTNDTIAPLRSNENNLETKYSPKANIAPSENFPQAPKQNLPQMSSQFQRSNFSDSNTENILKENTEVLFDSNEKDIQSDFAYQTESLPDQTDINENSAHELELINEKTRCELEEMASNQPENSEKAVFVCPNIGDNNFSIRASSAPNSKLIPSAVNYKQTDEMVDSLESNRTEGIFNTSTTPLKAENTSEMASNINMDEIVLKSSTPSIVPKFKVGSPITDTRLLQMEARKICREIQKEHELEMGCSLTSEVSLVSCSSFLDTGDYSLFDCSTDTMNFDESEIFKAGSKVKNQFFPKSAAETVSLPSLGSLKYEQIEALDLDNSVLSVSSITSEIDENYAKDRAQSVTCTGTYKIEAHNELPDDTSADVTLVSKADDTLNADLFDDDNSLHSQENLPLDVDTFQEESSNRVRTKLTPKERRKTFHERYRTYTIRDFKVPDRTGLAPNNTNRDKENDFDPRKEQEMPRDETILSQLKNNTCNQYDLAWDTEYNKENLIERTQPLDISSANLYRGRGGHEMFQFSKSFDKDRDYMPGLAFDSRSLNDLLSIGPSERKELADNAKLVAFSLKTAVQDSDTEFISDSEAEEPHKSYDIDTATYTKNFRDKAHSRLSLQEYQVLKDYKEPDVDSVEKCGAKIIKPSEKVEEEVTEEMSKGIRGRRKPLYASPQKSPLRMKGLSSGAATAKVAPVVVETKKPLLQQTCQSPPLHREGTFTKEDSSSPRSTEGKNVGSIPVPNKNIDTKTYSRLPSKTKVASSGGNTKVGENRVSRIGRPLSTYASRASEKKVEADSSQRRPFSSGAVNRTTGENTTIAKKPTSASPVSQKLRNSSSSQNMRAGNNSGIIKNKNLNTQSGKSQSDASLNLVDAKEKVCVGKGKNSKKEVTSKIATLWRKVEETKEKNKNIKDTRVWIGPEQSRTSSEALVMEKEEIVHIPTRTIVHSFTCQALTDGTCNDYTSRERNSHDVPFMREERQNKTQKRSIISAVVPPFNYNPPVPVVTPSNFKEVDNYQKNSLKVTTV